MTRLGNLMSVTQKSDPAVTTTISTAVVPTELGDRVLEVYKSCRDHCV